MTTRRSAPLLFALLLLCPGGAAGHDPSAWGGLFRSRDQGAGWLPVNEGRFIGGALAVAVSPVDPHHLLLATDSALLRSRNGGRDWQTEAPAVLVGGVFAVAFRADGIRALASTAQGLFATDDGATWRRAPIAKEALPARAILNGARGRVYLAGAGGFWRSDDGGAAWGALSDGLPDGAVTSAIVRGASPEAETVWAVAGGRVWKLGADAKTWEAADAGLPEGRVDTVAGEQIDRMRPGVKRQLPADVRVGAHRLPAFPLAAQVFKGNHHGSGPSARAPNQEPALVNAHAIDAIKNVL